MAAETSTLPCYWQSCWAKLRELLSWLPETDGTDGPTDAAGAVADNMTTKNARLLKIDIDDYIKRFDSYNFFKQEGGLIKTGPTLTNVMDIIVVLIDN